MFLIPEEICSILKRGVVNIGANNGLLKMRMCFEIFSTCVILKKENSEIPIILKTRFMYYSVDIICREEFYKSYEVKIST